MTMRRQFAFGRPTLRPSALALTLVGALGATSLLAGCSSVDDVVQGQSVSYQSSHAGPQLDVPPDLTQLAHDQRYTMPETGHAGPVSALAYQTTGEQQAAQPQRDAVLPQIPGMHIAQAGGQRWLVVDAAPDALWDKVQTFWQQNGFYLAKADAATGEMQTDWAENRAKLPQDLIRKYLGKVFDTLYDTGTRDRFRTVFQRTADGKGTEIFITHQTMVEVYTDAQKTQTTWQPGTPDPGLDSVFLQRLMVTLGMREQQAEAALQAPVQAAAARASLIEAGKALQVDDAFPEAWRRVGLAINTAGFTVTDRNRQTGTYDVRYVNPQAALKAQQDQEGFFGHLFGGKAKPVQAQDFHIVVQAAGDASRVTVQPVTQDAQSEESVTDILKVLLQQLQ